MKNFRAFVEAKPLVILDGAMGTQLDKRGQMGRGRTNLDAPEIVLDVHRAYIEAGARAIITNTLTNNRIFIESHNVGVSVQEVNLAGARIAKQAAGDGVPVLGDMCSTGQLLEPYGGYTEAQFLDCFREQAEVLAEGGVNALIIETLFDLREALIALQACKEVSSLPVIVTMAFGESGKTMMGNSAEDCARALTDAGADVIGANCGEIDPFQMAEMVAAMRFVTCLPIAVQPNAGKPKLIGDRTIFDMSPEDFAAGIAKCIEAGASLVGGCCGTTPEHIRRLADTLSETGDSEISDA